MISSKYVMQSYNYPTLGSLSAENTQVLGLNQMELARIRTYQMALQKPFLHESPYPSYVEIATLKIEVEKNFVPLSFAYISSILGNGTNDRQPLDLPSMITACAGCWFS